MTNPAAHKGTLRISAVICTYNRDRYINMALDSLAGQDLSRDQYEVIVIDNHSTDNTAAIVKEFMANHPELNIRYVFEPRKGLSFARNRGWQEAQSPIITYIDDDARAVPGFLQAILEMFREYPDAVGAGGRVVPAYESGHEPVWMSTYLNGFVGKVEFGEEPKVFEGKMKYPAGCNMTYKRSIIDQAGGFNNDLTFRSDDKYIYYKVTAISNKVYYTPKAIVHHFIDDYRTAFPNFRKLFLKTGNEEKVRIRTEEGFSGLVKKFLEYLFKLGASVLLALGFLIKGQGSKGKYLFLSQWFTLKGFLQKEVFVR
ncbi:glycosyltransferase [Flavihumibacter rivuli]|uniref:glycosyltransferase n=1 Tax=Flavihumibacter rivuli TaxID=2838156 RepID=UPI001BDF614E|nr:glycosyltransferase [Flavihumibacter rivuli]ULQ57424.1 glycosyltransferase [Flavihumibacter rivuli]